MSLLVRCPLFCGWNASKTGTWGWEMWRGVLISMGLYYYCIGIILREPLFSQETVLWNELFDYILRVLSPSWLDRVCSISTTCVHVRCRPWQPWCTRSVGTTSRSSTGDTRRSWFLVRSWFHQGIYPYESGHHWDSKVSLLVRCPHFRGWNASKTSTWGRKRCPHFRGP